METICDAEQHREQSDALQREFKGIQQDLSSPEALAKCIAMCNQFKLSASELATSWDAYLTNQSTEVNMKVNSAMLDRFKLHLQNRQQFQPASSPHKQATSSRVFTKETIQNVEVDTDLFAAYGVAIPESTKDVSSSELGVKRKSTSPPERLVTPTKRTSGHNSTATSVANSPSLSSPLVTAPQNASDSVTLNASSLSKVSNTQFVSPSSASSPTRTVAAASQVGSSPVATASTANSSSTPLRATSPSQQKQAQQSPSVSISPVATPGASYPTRKNRGQVIASLNTHLEEVISNGMPVSECIVRLESKEVDHYKYMVDNLSEKLEAFESHYESLRGVIAPLSEREQEKFHYARQDPILGIGRICCANDEEKLSAQDIVFEGGFEEGAPYRVRLDLCDVPEYFVFPGQVLGVEGKNTRGFALRASRLLQSPALPPRHVRRGKLHQLMAGAAAVPQQLGVMCANGPFLLSDTMSDAPLADLLAEFHRTRPTALILCGPFVDEKAPPVSTCSLGLTFEALQNHLLERVASEVLPHAHLIVLPALRDVAHVPVFPQPPFQLAMDLTPELRSRLHLLPNPSVFTIGDTSFAVSSEDILRHLSAATLHRNDHKKESTDRMSEIAKMVLANRSFYPLYPPDSSVNLDVTMFDRLRLTQHSPDVILFSSDLQPFAKIVESTVCVNPGRLARGRSGGSYAHFSVHPIPRSSLESAGVRIPTDARERVRVRIARV